MIKFLKIEKLKNSEKGITLIEIIVVIFIISMFSTILISDFPRILKEFALSRATYKLAQDLRRAQDLGLSGVQLKDDAGELIAAKGYGIYVNPGIQPTKYLIYADRGDTPDYSYDNVVPQLCSQNGDAKADCILETIDVSAGNPSLYIKELKNIDNGFASINFNPPNPTISIYNISSGYSEVGISLGLEGLGEERTVWINTSGLIWVQ